MVNVGQTFNGLRPDEIISSSVVVRDATGECYLTSWLPKLRRCRLILSSRNTLFIENYHRVPLLELELTPSEQKNALDLSYRAMMGVVCPTVDRNLHVDE